MDSKTMANDQHLKEVLKAFGDSELLASELTQGFEFAELTQLITVANDLPVVLQDASVLWPEYKALDSAAQGDLVAFAQANCKFPSNLTVQAWVQKVLTAAVFLSSLFSMFQAKPKAA